MKHEQCTEAYDLLINPNDEYTATPADLIAAGGYVTAWVLDYAMLPVELLDTTSLRDYLDKQYGFGLFEMTGGVVDPTTLVYLFPEDPPMHPIFTITCKFGSGAKFIFYPHAICAMRESDDDEWFVTRMD